MHRGVAIDLSEKLVEEQPPHRFRRSGITGKQRTLHGLGQVRQREDRLIDVGEERGECARFFGCERFSRGGRDGHSGRSLYFEVPEFRGSWVLRFSSSGGAE